MNLVRDLFDFHFDLDLGEDHYLSWTHQARIDQKEGRPTDERGPIGAIVSHRLETGHYCFGSIMFDVPHLREELRIRGTGQPAPLWKIEYMDPLTLSPSLMCACGDHGFVRDGKWVRA